MEKESKKKTSAGPLGCWLDLAGTIGPNPGDSPALVEVDEDFGAPEIWSAMASPKTECYFASFGSEAEAREWIARHGLRLERVIYPERR